MVTMVGKQDEFSAAMTALLELEYDALEAYEVAIDRISAEYKQTLTDFMTAHQRHISELTSILAAHQQSAPTGPTGKQWLTKGKVALASLIGDKAILLAMRSNEEDTNTAYERMTHRTDRWADVENVLNQNLADEKRHKAWLEQTCHSLAS